MARRGRFGSPSGGANLSALVQSLLRQKKGQEEQLLLEQFKNGQISLDTLMAFYNDWLASSGYSPDSIEYKSIQQSMASGRNQGLVLQYNKLYDEFVSSNGANYQALMDFLNGPAMGSTDAQNLSSFKSAKQSVTNEYIRNAATRLSSGQITTQEFKAELDRNFDTAFPPDDPASRDARYNALQAEYNTMKSIWSNRINANKPGAYAGFQAFVKSFQKDMLSYGISTNSDLFTQTQADAATARTGSRSAAASPSVDRANAASDKIGAVLDAIAKTGMTDLQQFSLEDIQRGKKYGVADLMNNPGLIATVTRLVDSGMMTLPPELSAIGINNTVDLNNYVDLNVRQYSAGVASAAAVNPTAELIQANTNAKYLASSIGARTGVDEYRDALGQYTDDIHRAEASGDDVAMGLAMDNWRKYLNGSQSKYGVIPSRDMLAPAGSGSAGAAILASVDVSKRAMNGEIIGSGEMPSETLFGIAAKVTGDKVLSFADAYASGSVTTSMTNFQQLKSGLAVQHVSYDPQTGAKKYTTELPSAVGPTGTIPGTNISAKGGRLSMLTFKDDGNGGAIPVVQSIDNYSTILIGTSGDTAAQTWGYVYRTDSGENIYVSSKGKAYNGSPFAGSPQLVGGNMFVTADVSANAVELPRVPSIDTASIIRIAGNGDPAKAGWSDIRATVENVRSNLNPQIMALLPNAGKDAEADLGNSLKIADNLELEDINRQLGSQRDVNYNDRDTILKLHARANEILSGEGSTPEDQRVSTGSLYNQQVAPYKDKYVETEPGLFRLRSNDRVVVPGPDGRPQTITNNMLKDKFGRPLAQEIDLRSQAAKDAARNAVVANITAPIGLMGQNLASLPGTFAGAIGSLLQPSAAAPTNYSSGYPTAPLGGSTPIQLPTTTTPVPFVKPIKGGV